MGVGYMFRLKSYDLIKDYSFGTERSTGIEDYDSKGCMEGGNLKITISGRKSGEKGSLVYLPVLTLT